MSAIRTYVRTVSDTQYVYDDETRIFRVKRKKKIPGTLCQTRAMAWRVSMSTINTIHKYVRLIFYNYQFCRDTTTLHPSRPVPHP